MQQIDPTAILALISSQVQTIAVLEQENAQLRQVLSEQSANSPGQD